MFSLIGQIDLLCRFRKCGRVTKNQDLPAWHESCIRLVTSDVNSTSSEKLTCSQSSNTSSSLAVEARCSIRRHISAQMTAGISCYSAQKPALLDRKVLTLLSGTQYSLLPGLRGCRDHLKRHTHLLSFPATTPLCIPPCLPYLPYWLWPATSEQSQRRSNGCLHVPISRLSDRGVKMWKTRPELLRSPDLYLVSASHNVVCDYVISLSHDLRSRSFLDFQRTIAIHLSLWIYLMQLFPSAYRHLQTPGILKP